MTNIEKWCQEHKVKVCKFLSPCLIIGEAWYCDICPYHFMDEHECTSLCNAWGKKEYKNEHQ